MEDRNRKSILFDDNLSEDKPIKGSKRLVIEVSNEDHAEIKKIISSQGITIRKWVLRAIAQKIKAEKLYE